MLHHAAQPTDEQPDATIEHRIGAILFATRLVRLRKRAVLLLDEIEEILPSQLGRALGERSPLSKLSLHRLLEENETPAIWITNHPGSLGAALLRRFRYAIRFEAPTARRRRAILDRLDGARCLRDADRDRLAARYEASPALLRNAIATASLAAPRGSPSPAAVEAVLRPTVELVTGERIRLPDAAAAESFDLGAIRADTDLARLAHRLGALEAATTGGVAICLHGPPGTGKTAYAHHLARSTGRRLVARRGSDLRSAYVGETEQRLAAAFREAEDDGALLLLDEIDSFLADRRGARARHEVAETNEVLQQLESFRGLVVCTTNRLEALDPAALRRFALKVRFDWPDAAQRRVLFERLLVPLLPRGVAITGACLRALDAVPHAAPGDFAAARRRLAVLGGARCADELVTALRAEVDLRGDARRRVGF